MNKHTKTLVALLVAMGGGVNHALAAAGATFGSGNSATGLGDSTATVGGLSNRVTLSNSVNSTVIGNKNGVGGQLELGSNSTTVIGNNNTGSVMGIKNNSVLGSDNRLNINGERNTYIGSQSDNMKISGSDNTGIGTNVKISGNNNMALGKNTTVTGSNSVALGSDSEATENDVVSVGSSKKKRKIINIADGVAQKGARSQRDTTTPTETVVGFINTTIDNDQARKAEIQKHSLHYLLQWGERIMLWQQQVRNLGLVML